MLPKAAGWAPWAVAVAAVAVACAIGAAVIHDWRRSIADAASAACELRHAVADAAERDRVAERLDEVRAAMAAEIHQMTLDHTRRTQLVIQAERQAAAETNACSIAANALQAARAVR